MPDRQKAGKERGMNRILATIKAPLDQVEAIRKELAACGVSKVDVKTVPFETFAEESRMNYDCVFPQLWEEKKPVAYLDFSFDATDEGRAASFQVEYNLMQIPLNLRYEF